MLGEKIRRIIRNSPFSQKRIAEMLGISENALINYAKNRRIPDAVTIVKIAEICDADINYLLIDTNSVDGNIGKFNKRPNEPDFQKEIVRMGEKIDNMDAILRRLEEDKHEISKTNQMRWRKKK
jgi:transcriptional regulator with XRE-family HTH domain